MRLRLFSTSKPMLPARRQPSPPSTSITKRPKCSGSWSDRSTSSAIASRWRARRAERYGSTSPWFASSTRKSTSAGWARLIRTLSRRRLDGRRRGPAAAAGEADGAGAERDAGQDEREPGHSGRGHRLAEEDRSVAERERGHEVRDEDRARRAGAGEQGVVEDVGQSRPAHAQREDGGADAEAREPARQLEGGEGKQTEGGRGERSDR